MKIEPLKKGDIVEIVAPSFSCSQKALNDAIALLKEWGLRPRCSKSIFGSDLLCANKDKVRKSHLQKALLQKDSSLIWCLRGGYGAARLFDKPLKKPSKKKIILGYSDISFLHHYVNSLWKWPSLHGPVLDGFAQGIPNQKSQRLLKKILFGEISEVSFSLKPLNALARKNKVIQSVLHGGNLSILQTVLGTKYQSSSKNKILFLEDVGEQPYAIDRMLVHLSQSGFLKSAKGVVFGNFLNDKEISFDRKAKEVLLRFAKESDFPVLGGLPCGHGSHQETLPFNTKATLKLGARASLKVQTGLV